LLFYVQNAGVAAYLAGHDHDLQHNIKLSNPADDDSDPVWPHHVVSGAGSETRKNEKKNYKGKVRAAGRLRKGSDLVSWLLYACMLFGS
jgi:hypothetical protein